MGLVPAAAVAVVTAAGDQMCCSDSAGRTVAVAAVEAVADAAADAAAVAAAVQMDLEYSEWIEADSNWMDRLANAV